MLYDAGVVKGWLRTRMAADAMRYTQGEDAEARNTRSEWGNRLTQGNGCPRAERMLAREWAEIEVHGRKKSSEAYAIGASGDGETRGSLTRSAAWQLGEG